MFDPLNLASDDSERTSKLREAEIKHARLAMVSFLGYAVQVGAAALTAKVASMQAATDCCCLGTGVPHASAIMVAAEVATHVCDPSRPCPRLPLHRPGTPARALWARCRSSPTASKQLFEPDDVGAALAPAQRPPAEEAGPVPSTSSLAALPGQSQSVTSRAAAAGAAPDGATPAPSTPTPPEKKQPFHAARPCRPPMSCIGLSCC